MRSWKTICITGAGGMLGVELVRAARQILPDCELHALARTDLDVTDANAVDAAIGRVAPALVINAAAYTDVDGCETHQDLAHQVNGVAPGLLAAACRRHACRLVHVSTDFVFDGRKGSPYLPDDPVNPLSVYGHSKAEGERHVRETLDDHVIVRTSWLFAAHGRNFVRTILRLAAERDELQVVDDQIGCPTYAPDLAAALLAIGVTSSVGTHHFCNAGSCSWHGFALQILRISGAGARILPISSGYLDRPARRPSFSVLKNTLSPSIKQIPQNWQGALKECMRMVLAYLSGSAATA